MINVFRHIDGAKNRALFSRTSQCQKKLWDFIKDISNRKFFVNFYFPILTNIEPVSRFWLRYSVPKTEFSVFVDWQHLSYILIKHETGQTHI